MLTKLPQFYKEVNKYWEDTIPLFFSTSALFRFSKKLKGIKDVLRSLSKDKLGDLSKRTKEAYEELCLKQSQTLANPNPYSLEEESISYQRWQHLSVLEEGYLKQKSKLHWLALDDQNNSYFQKSITIRKMRNSIRQIMNTNGDVLTNGEEIKQVAGEYFQNILSHKPPDYQGMSIADIQELIQFRCTDLEREDLTREVTEEEIKKVLFSMPNDK